MVAANRLPVDRRARSVHCKAGRRCTTLLDAVTKYQFGHHSGFRRTQRLTAEDEMLCMDLRRRSICSAAHSRTQATRVSASKRPFSGWSLLSIAPDPDEKEARAADDRPRTGLRQQHGLYMTEGEQSDSFYALCALYHYIGERASLE